MHGHSCKVWSGLTTSGVLFASHYEHGVMCVYIISTCELGLEQETDGRQSADRFATHESEILCKPSQRSSDCSIYSSQTDIRLWVVLDSIMWDVEFLGDKYQSDVLKIGTFCIRDVLKIGKLCISVMSWTSAYFVDTGCSGNPAACLPL